MSFLYVGLLAVWIAFILGTTARTIVASWSHTASREPSPSPLRVLTDPHLHIEFEAEQVLPSQRLLQGLLRVTTPVNGMDTVFTRHPRTQNQQLEIDMTARDVSSLSCGDVCQVLKKNIPIRSLFNTWTYQGSKTFTYQVSVPLSGTPENYPQDKYQAKVSLAYTPPSGYLTKGKLITFKFTPGKTKDDFSVPSPISRRSGRDRKLNDQFFVTFQRSNPSILYIYALASVPLLFAFLFLHLLFFNPASRKLSLLDTMSTLIVTTLAILPLRTVLVPAEFEGLTRVDLVLGLGLVVTLCLAVGKYAADIMPRGPGQPGSGQLDDAAAQG